jgi:hypothetical protein
MSSVTGQDNVIRMLLAVKDGARVKLLETMNTVATDMQRYVQAEKLSGNPIKRVTGLLRDSIFERVSESGTAVSAVTGTGLSYAKGLEDGNPPHVIVPVRAKMLSFVVGGTRVFARKVNHPGNRAFHYLRDTLHETAPAEIGKIRAAMADLITEARA